MFSFLKRVSGLDRPAPPQQPEDPVDANLVIAACDLEDDGFTQVSVRPMTYAEVAGLSPSLASAKPRPNGQAQAAKSAKGKVVTAPVAADTFSPAEDEELYGDVAETVYEPRRKHKRRARARRAAAA